MNKRVRNIGLILYPEDNSHILALDYIKHNYENYIYILHNRDLNKNYEIVKEHYHVILHFPNARTTSTLSKQLGIGENLFYEIKSLNGQLRYLIHYDDDDKVRYEIDEVKGTLYMIGKFKKSFRDSQDEASEVALIYEFIFDNDINDLQTLLEFVLDNNLYSSFRRNYVMFKDLIHFNKKGGSIYDKNKKNW